VGLELLGAWQCDASARRSTHEYRLAALRQRQAIALQPMTFLACVYYDVM